VSESIFKMAIEGAKEDELTETCVTPQCCV